MERQPQRPEFRNNLWDFQEDFFYDFMRGTFIPKQSQITTIFNIVSPHVLISAY